MSETQNAQKSVKDHVVTIKNYFVEMPKQKKIGIGVVAAIVVIAAIVITVVLNVRKPEYCVLYPGLEASEASSVYQTLKEMGAEPQLNAAGEVTVPQSEYDTLLLQLAAKGYPQSALTYDIFSNHSGLTSTESEQEQWLVFQLQDRIQSTLGRMAGVSGSTVTINLPENSDYVWQQATSTQKGSASVLLNLQNNVTLSGEQINAIKKLVASSAPQLEPADVTVVNAATMLEMKGNIDDEYSSLTDSQTLEFEKQVQKQLEDNIVRVLAPRYGSDGVIAVAKATIDFDKMMTERMELLERDDPDGGGFPTEFSEDYSKSGTTGAGGVAGEEDNTDIPTYPYTNGAGINGSNDYHRDLKYDYGYLKTQIEKGNAILSRATVSVMVNENNLTDARREELTSLISMSADIDPDFIVVSSFTVPTVPQPDEPDQPVINNGFDFSQIPVWVYITVGGILLAIIILVVILLRTRKKAKKIEEEKDIELESAQQDLQQEIERYKLQLSESAKAKVDPKEDAIVGEVRDFAKQNPEITASLLRNWLKEGEE